MRYRNQNEEEDNLLSEMGDLLSSDVATEVKVETKVEETEEEESFLIPLDYQIFSTHNNEPTGKREVVDTYKCDRKKGIVPSGKARVKADLMKKAFANKKFFVEEIASKIFGNGRARTVSRIYYQTK